MSNLEDGRRVRCDGQGCSQTASLPVALKSTLTAPASSESTAIGWLFVTTRDGHGHYCPRCAASYLAYPETLSIASQAGAGESAK